MGKGLELLLHATLPGYTSIQTVNAFLKNEAGYEDGYSSGSITSIPLFLAAGAFDMAKAIPYVALTQEIISKYNF
ncbi:hypothetical protein ISS07_01720 [Candidatus Woesearchaeota archaeon]|nr:hypothetical protein [Candidatus Woesearchaeota archaeon]